jgi:hypothetical protein
MHHHLILIVRFGTDRNCWDYAGGPKPFIVNTITTNISYTNVKIEDTLNSTYVDYVLPDDAEAPAFSYSYTKNGQPYTPTYSSSIPEASYDGSKVTWNLGDIELEKGVTYAVSFDVQLKQEAYDEAAKTKGDFKVYTNDTGTLSYQKITRVTGQDPVYSDIASLEYEKPQVTVPVSTLTVSKKWILNGGTAPESLTPKSLVVKVFQGDIQGNDNKEYTTVTLNAANNWTAKVNVAAGPLGHTYSVAENPGDQWQQSLPDPVKLIGLTSKTGRQDITNTYKTGTLTLTKKIKGNAANTSDTFKFDLSCADLKNKEFRSGNKTISFDSEGKATVDLTNGETIELNNVPAGKAIVITERASDTPNAKMTTVAKVGNDTTTFDKDQAKTVRATVADGGTTEVVYTNRTDIAPDTGLDISTTSQGVLLGVAAAGAATLAAAAIRKNHGERKER